MTRYSKKENSDFRPTSMSVRSDIYEMILKYKKEYRIRNRSIAIERLIVKGLQAEGYKVKL